VQSEDKKKHNQTHVTLFQNPFGVSDFLKQTPNQTQTPSTKWYPSSAWSKHWHAGRMRPADSFCAACVCFLHAVHYTVI